MRKRLALAGTAATVFCIASLPAYAAGTTRSGSDSTCSVVSSACSVSGSHTARSFTNWCTSSGGIYTSCSVEHSCSATAYGTWSTGQLNCSGSSTTSCSSGNTGQCTMNRLANVNVAHSTCGTFTITATSNSGTGGGSAQWSDTIYLCVDPYTGPYVL